MTEDTKIILKEMAKLQEKLCNEMAHEVSGIRQELSAMRKEMIDEFKAVRSELQHLHDDLSNKIDDLQQVTARNCYELALLKANSTNKTEE